MKRLYFIAGPNGAGKTTASFELLPELWDCREFVNADEIARGLSPLNPEEMAMQAGRLQLERIRELLNEGATFSIETTLATRIYLRLIAEARRRGYEVEMLFFYLPSPADAKERVRMRVRAGGHNIPEDVIERRYELGLSNLFRLYMPVVDRWKLINNFESPSVVIAERCEQKIIYDKTTFNSLQEKYGTRK